ncbi:MAG: LUD domain-containing protein [Salinirussus sp.]
MGRGDRAAALDRLLATEGAAVRENTTGLNDQATRSLDGFSDREACRAAARQIKEDAIEDLPQLIDRVEESVRANGGHVHLASTASDARDIVAEIMAAQDAESLAKSKSMTTEELELNQHLEAEGYEVTETDLGEYVIQVADEAPSHLIAPAIHKAPADIAACFNEVFDPEPPLSADPEALTAFARERVGTAIRDADVGMTGANFIVADSGSILLVTNEGNARKTAVTPPVHIAVAGVEKLVPTLEDLAPFTELIAKSGTGQDITSYVSLLTPPVDTPIPDFGAGELRQAAEREFHLVLVDNGRMAMREDEQLRETLYCIRCGACANACANFQAVGGHAFGGETYTGGIGTGWEAGIGGLEAAADMNDLCTGCSRCVPKCPVKIDIPWINTVVRDRLNRDHPPSEFQFLVDGLVPDEEGGGIDIQKRFFGNIETIAKLGSRVPRLANAIAEAPYADHILERAVGVASERDLPRFATETLHDWYANRGPMVEDPVSEVVLYPDLYTNYFDPGRGQAAVRLLEAVGTRVHIPSVPESGRAPLSQGMVASAESAAEAVYGRLSTHLDRDRVIVAIEPSDLAMFRSDYDRLLPDRSAERLREHSYDVLEFVNARLEATPALRDDLAGPQGDPAVAYHSHCQQRTLGLETPTIRVLEAAGYDVTTSSVECCGMAGSFGYKTEYHGVSMDVGAQLREDLGANPGRIVASGTSCQEQLRVLYDREVPHPVELLA